MGYWFELTMGPRTELRTEPGTGAGVELRTEVRIARKEQQPVEKDH